MAKPRMSFERWRAEVKKRLIARTKLSAKKVEAKIRSSESGPAECIPSMRELWEDGETPAAFVANEFYEGRY